MKNVSEFIESLLEDICLDERIPNATFEITNSHHLDILHEYASKKVNEDFAYLLLKELRVDEGNFPERQAYNKDGVLVTFPDEESKKAALDRKTHFDNDPSGGSKETDDTSNSDVDTDDENSEESNEVGEGGEEPEETEEPDSIFKDFTTPEEKFSEIDPESTREYSEFKIIPKKDDEGPTDDPSKDVHHVYDILTTVKKSQLDDNIIEL